MGGTVGAATVTRRCHDDRTSWSSAPANHPLLSEQKDSKMTVNENDRLMLRDALIRVFADPTIADIAMEAMPPIDYTNVAKVSDIANLRLHMDARFAGVDARFAAVDARFDRMETRFDAVDHRFDAIDAKFGALDATFGGLDAKFGAFDATFGALEAKFGALEAKFGALEAKFGALHTSVEGMIDSKLSAQMRLMFLMQLGTIAAVTGIIQASV